jgi:hypothetical protein
LINLGRISSAPEPDPDLNGHENQDPDPIKVGSDPQHCLLGTITVPCNVVAERYSKILGPCCIEYLRRKMKGNS